MLFNLFRNRKKLFQPAAVVWVREDDDYARLVHINEIDNWLKNKTTPGLWEVFSDRLILLENSDDLIFLKINFGNRIAPYKTSKRWKLAVRDSARLAWEVHSKDIMGQISLIMVLAMLLVLLGLVIYEYTQKPPDGQTQSNISIDTHYEGQYFNAKGGLQ